jgi:regulator of protease activity HflC (stomatin/prohibitin superfamily)
MLSTRKLVVGTIVGILILVLLIRSFTIVPAGHVKVVSLFGKVRDKELYPGFRIVNPLANRISMDIRTKEQKESMQTPTSEGLIASVDLSVLHRIVPDRASDIYKELGINYVDVVVIPNIRNSTRDVIATYKSEDLYNPNRKLISSDIAISLEKQFVVRYVILDTKDSSEAVLLRDLALPDKVKTAIEEKMEEKQKSEKMSFTLSWEKQEADRKRIEAQGIADAQHIIASSLTNEYLQWRYITTIEDIGKDGKNNTFFVTPYGTNLIPMVNIPTPK